MKKILLYTALGAAMLASCSQDESLETIESRGGELSFRTTVGYATRANVADLDMVKTDGFKVTAYLYGMDGETKKVQTSPYFNDMAVTWDADKWSHAQRYWPGSNEYVETGVAAKGFDFVAYSPSAITGVTYTDDRKMKVTDYTIPAAVVDEKDLVVANAQNQTEAANGTNGVSLDFKHVLSQVVVKASNASSFYHIDVEKVEIHNVHGKGTLTYDYAATTPATWAITDATVSSNAYTSALTSAATIGTGASALHANSNYYMMLPQTSGVWNPETEVQTAAGAYFVVSCKIYSGEGANKEYLFGIGSASGYGRVAIPVPANGTGTNEGKLVWENGKKYTYTLNFFKDGGGAGYQEPGSTVPSKSITPGTVKFSASVSVEAWGEGDASAPEGNGADPGTARAPKHQ